MGPLPSTLCSVCSSSRIFPRGSPTGLLCVDGRRHGFPSAVAFRSETPAAARIFPCHCRQHQLASLATVGAALHIVRPKAHLQYTAYFKRLCWVPGYKMIGAGGGVLVGQAGKWLRVQRTGLCIICRPKPNLRSKR